MPYPRSRWKYAHPRRPSRAALSARQPFCRSHFPNVQLGIIVAHRERRHVGITRQLVIPAADSPNVNRIVRSIAEALAPPSLPPQLPPRPTSPTSGPLDSPTRQSLCGRAWTGGTQACAHVHTQLLCVCVRVRGDGGGERSGEWGARPADLSALTYGGERYEAAKEGKRGCGKNEI